MSSSHTILSRSGSLGTLSDRISSSTLSHDCFFTSWSYLINLTYIGNAVYISMDIPDIGLAFCSILNYLQLDRTKVVCFVVFMGIWAYFRHYLNIIMLWSVYSEFDLMPCVVFSLLYKV